MNGSFPHIPENCRIFVVQCPDDACPKKKKTLKALRL